MGLFDIFSTTDQTNAANAQIAGLTAGNTQATGNINSGIGAINTGYSAALQPFMQNYGTANAGVDQLKNALGFGGPTGTSSALNTLEQTPGFQFQKTQGDSAITAADAASGKTASGNEALALSNYNQGLAGTTYQNYVNNLLPFMGLAQNSASGIANVNTGQANATAGQYDTLANLNYQTNTGIGNANANKDLAGLTQSGNLMNLFSGIASAAMGMPGMGGGFSGGTPGSAIPGSVGPTSFGGPSGPAPLTGGSMFGSVFSDERLKEFIEPVGELYDGTNVYRYNYIGDPTPRIGLMAQEVEKVRPDAVVEIGGFKAVDYGKATDYAADLARFLEAA